ncbi:MAG: hypothetical protein ACOY7L_03270 [Pseudomonadota bacterium]|nr:MAG: hypothetical protein A2885_07585 [Sphingopyxis sp. RIFCSPHIGHO2_01_FULL_65_24]
MGHLSIEALEAHTRTSERDPVELTLVLAELGYRKTKRAQELKDLVARLHRAAASKEHGAQ